jgi:hypothetical protein
VVRRLIITVCSGTTLRGSDTANRSRANGVPDPRHTISRSCAADLAGRPPVRRRFRHHRVIVELVEPNGSLRRLDLHETSPGTGDLFFQRLACMP